MYVSFAHRGYLGEYGKKAEELTAYCVDAEYFSARITDCLGHSGSRGN